MEHPESMNFKSKFSRRIINTPGPAAKSAFFYMQETGVIKPEDAPATHRRDLDSFLIVAVASGSGELEYDGHVYPLKKGDCFFIDCRVSHFYKSSADDPWELLWVHFNGATSRQYHDYFIGQSEVVFRPAIFDRFASVITEMIEVNAAKKPEAEILTSRLIVELLTLSLTVNSSASQYDTALKQKLAAVNSYIEDHFSEDLSLEKLSSEFYISKFYLTREYKKIYGKTIFQHIISCRINYGKHLLRFSDRSVEEISHLCGFNDQSYFARQFKKAENLTCFAYRKKWRD
ncbi:MAG: AraC family transcriptional regulator [Ruminococcus sp.]|nr:AraC family transcriptional regulator [Ruminococcus sp.]